MNPFQVFDDIRRQDWRDAALCAQVDPDRWFPAKGETAADVKAICRQCPVRRDCLEYAVVNNEIWGVWGGLNSKERRELRKGRAA